MPAVNTSGSQIATIGTEHDLATVTAAKTLQLVVDCSGRAEQSAPDRPKAIAPRKGLANG